MMRERRRSHRLKRNSGHISKANFGSDICEFESSRPSPVLSPLCDFWLCGNCRHSRHRHGATPQRRGGRNFFDEAITQQLADHFAGSAALENWRQAQTRGRMARSQCLGRMAVPLIPATVLAGPPSTPDAPAPRRTTTFPPMFAGLGIILAAVGLGLG